MWSSRSSGSSVRPAGISLSPVASVAADSPPCRRRDRSMPVAHLGVPPRSCRDQWSHVGRSYRQEDQGEQSVRGERSKVRQLVSELSPRHLLPDSSRCVVLNNARDSQKALTLRRKALREYAASKTAGMLRSRLRLCPLFHALLSRAHFASEFSGTSAWGTGKKKSSSCRGQLAFRAIHRFPPSSTQPRCRLWTHTRLRAPARASRRRDRPDDADSFCDRLVAPSRPDTSEPLPLLLPGRCDLLRGNAGSRRDMRPRK